ncbi:DASH complex subunit Dad4 [Phycomyces nitens]|nr:DASH complex subunit Dad4 [Phycomyces nitens]
MENPHEQQQNALINRIAANVNKLNGTVQELNKRLEAMNEQSKSIVALGQIWSAYNASVEIHLDNTKSFADPV